MPEDSKKSQNKGKHDAKEQRKPRQSRQHGPDKAEKKAEKKTEESKATVVPSKPVYEDPGPEFYKGLKRETDEILKITEEANAKYKKKEIQSNWTKYEMPIESYDEIEEQENLGADYETLSQAPLSVGGHFQFKHEKSWDIDTGPSLYDKYFEIDMENLATALSTIPFYERNSIEKEIFSETDVSTMDNRSVKYKRKYYNNTSYTTPELGAQDNILSTLKESIRTKSQSEHEKEGKNISVSGDIISETGDSKPPKVVRDPEITLVTESKKKEEIKTELPIIEKPAAKLGSQKEIDEIDDLILGTTEVAPKEVESSHSKLDNLLLRTETKSEDAATSNPSKAQPIIESPEDLEKWLDDFLDG